MTFGTYGEGKAKQMRVRPGMNHNDLLFDLHCIYIHIYLYIFDLLDIQYKLKRKLEHDIFSLSCFCKENVGCE